MVEKEKRKYPAPQPETIPDLEKISRADTVEGIPIDDESKPSETQGSLNPTESVKTFG